MTTTWIEEFLYRGRAPDAVEPPAWHLIIQSRLDDGAGNSALLQPRILNMAQAKEEGWDLPQVIAEMNSEALVALATTQAQLETAKIDLEAAQGRSQETSAELVPTPVQVAVPLTDEAIPVLVRIRGAS